MHDDLFMPGDQIPCSGIYRVLHRDHRESHDATLLDGQAFPACTVCGAEVRFRLVKESEAARQDGNRKDQP